MKYYSDDVLVHASDVAHGILDMSATATCYKDDVTELVPIFNCYEPVTWAPFRQQARLLRDILEEYEFYSKLDGDPVYRGELP